MIFTTHHQIADWVDKIYSVGDKVRIATFNYYLDINETADFALPYKKNGSRRIIDTVSRKDLDLVVGVPGTCNDRLVARYIETERRLKLNAIYLKNSHFKMIAVGENVLIGGINLDTNTTNSDAMFLSKGKIAREAIRFFENLKLKPKFNFNHQTSIRISK